MENSNENVTQFEPSELQVKVLEVSYNFEGKPTVTALCEEAGIARKTWYEWNNNEGFVTWWAENWKRHMQRNMWQLDRISYLKAGKDFRYMELLQMKYDKFARNENISHDFHGLSEEKLDEILARYERKRTESTETNQDKP
jgi:hypothetical protein